MACFSLTMTPASLRPMPSDSTSADHGNKGCAGSSMEALRIPRERERKPIRISFHDRRARSRLAGGRWLRKSQDKKHHRQSGPLACSRRQPHPRRCRRRRQAARPVDHCFSQCDDSSALGDASFCGGTESAGYMALKSAEAGSIFAPGIFFARKNVFVCIGLDDDITDRPGEHRIPGVRCSRRENTAASTSFMAGSRDISRSAEHRTTRSWPKIDPGRGEASIAASYLQRLMRIETDPRIIEPRHVFLDVGLHLGQLNLGAGMADDGALLDPLFIMLMLAVIGAIERHR